MTTPITIDEQYDQFLTIKESEDSNNEKIQASRNLIHRLVEEDSQVLDNPMYLTMLDEELALIEQGYMGIANITQIIAISKALLSHYKGVIVDVNEVKRIVRLENPLGSIYDNTMEWLVDYLMGVKKSEAQKKVLSFMANFEKHAGFENVDVVFTKQPDTFDSYNTQFSNYLTEIMSGHYIYVSKRSLALLCISMYIMNSILGIEVEAKYFIMKATQIPVDEKNLKVLIDLLATVALFNEIQE